MKTADITTEKIAQIQRLNEIAKKRAQSLAQMSIAWLLKDPHITSVLIGASSVQQLDDNIDSLNGLSFHREELNAIEQILNNNTDSVQ